jgi:hypothetical protein
VITSDVVADRCHRLGDLELVGGQVDAGGAHLLGVDGGAQQAGQVDRRRGDRQQDAVRPVRGAGISHR